MTSTTTRVAELGRHSDGAIVTNDDTVASASATAAMNIFEKFSSLNRSIEETRQTMKAIRIKIEEIQQSIQTSRQEQTTMKRDIQVAQKESNEFHQQVDQGNETLFQLQADQSRAMVEHRRAQRELENVKMFVEEQRRQFLERSRDFRASCRRARFSAATMGLEYAPLRAFATVYGMVETDVTSGDRAPASSSGVLLSAFEESNEGVFHPAMESLGEITVVADETATLSDPAQWNPDPRDDEMKTALALYDTELGLYKSAKHGLEESRARHKKSRDQAASRSQRKEQLLAQLHRIEKDNTDMEAKLTQLAEETEEAKALGKGFEKDVKARRQEMAQRRFEAGDQSRGPRVFNSVVGNPYAKRSQNPANTNGSVCAPGTSNNGNPSNCARSTTPSVRQPPPRRTGKLSEAQHPHRTGRVRVDRQFTSNVSIFASQGGGALSSNVPNNEAASATSRMGGIHSLLSDDDSDEDNELLSFKPFSKKQKN